MIEGVCQAGRTLGPEAVVNRNCMLTEFEATIIDDRGHFDIPAEFRERVGLIPGAHLRIEDRITYLLITHIESPEERMARQLAAQRR